MLLSPDLDLEIIALLTIARAYGGQVGKTYQPSDSERMLGIAELEGPPVKPKAKSEPERPDDPDGDGGYQIRYSFEPTFESDSSDTAPKRAVHCTNTMHSLSLLSLFDSKSHSVS